MFLSSVLSTFVDELFPGMEVQGAYQFRVTRNSELVVDEEEVENLALALRDQLLALTPEQAAYKGLAGNRMALAGALDLMAQAKRLDGAT